MVVLWLKRSCSPVGSIKYRTKIRPNKAVCFVSLPYSGKAGNQNRSLWTFPVLTPVSLPMSDPFVWGTDDSIIDPARPLLWKVPGVERVSNLKSYFLIPLGLDPLSWSDARRWSPWLTKNDHSVEVQLRSQGAPSLGFGMAQGHGLLIKVLKLKKQKEIEREEVSVTPEQL